MLRNIAEQRGRAPPLLIPFCQSAIQSNHSISFGSLPEKVTAAISPELTMIDRQNRLDREHLRQLLLVGLDSCPTTTQRRRLWLYCVEGWTVRRIADAENVKHPSIVESLAAA